MKFVEQLKRNFKTVLKILFHVIIFVLIRVTQVMMIKLLEKNIIIFFNYLHNVRQPTCLIFMTLQANIKVTNNLVYIGISIMNVHAEMFVQ